jgi:EAL domain-containing protein (putative c-di-GMP-specific phosphodiesterase class I)
MAVTAPPRGSAAEVTSVREILDRDLVCPVFQPIVALTSGEVVGYEALARGPAGSPLESPGALFPAAVAENLTLELDWACRDRAVRAALDAGLHPSRALFVNVEPGTLGVPVPTWAAATMSRARNTLCLVTEVTERALIDSPASLLTGTARLRAAGSLIALDDIGADPRSLGLLPFAAPEVVKLDQAVTQAADLAATARSASAVHAYAERAQANIVAEGIETPTHRDTALACGADLGQGWLFGRPGPLPREAARPVRASIARAPGARPEVSATPFELLVDRRPLRRGTKALLLRMSRALESQAGWEGDASVVISTFQDVAFFTPQTRARYRHLARNAAFVGALGVGMDAVPEPGVRGASLLASEPLRGEWDVVAVGPYNAAAFTARDLGDTGLDGQRRFDFVMTHDRDLVVRAASALMARVSPS